MSISQNVKKSDNKPKECVKSRKEDYLKPDGKYARLNELQEETKTI